jgi:triacylglycerol esterase/lipase EstA (alpha/beta hydrolase family)
MWMFKTEQIPLILVHGWRPEKNGNTVLVWDKIKAALHSENIPYYEFNYLPATGDPYIYAANLESFINNIEKITGYSGKFDIICHSMGALVSRFYMARNNNYKKIRQWIGIAPVNQGAALADLMDSKSLLFLMIKPLISLFFSDINSSGAVANMQTYDKEILVLNKRGRNRDGLESGVKYHVIMGYKVPLQTGFNASMASILKWISINSRDEYASYQSVIKKGFEPTRVKLTINRKILYRWTANGDGTVANSQSILPQVIPDRIPCKGHSDLNKDFNVINLVLNYYQNYKKP